MGKGALVRWLPAAAWMAVIFCLSSKPKPPLSWFVDQVDWGDRLAHLAVYLILGALVWLALAGVSAGWRRAAIAVVIAVAYGLSDEAHQMYVPGRSFDLVDLAADGLGAAAAAVIMKLSFGGGEDAGRTGRREDV